MKLSDITKKTPLIKDFVNRLAKSTKQSIPIVEPERVKRISGASVKPVNLVLENGQQVKLYVRLMGDDAHLDIFRIDINGKRQVLSGDYDNSYKPAFNASVDVIANTIVQGQSAFDKKQANIKPKNTTAKKSSAPKNKAQQRNALLEQAKELDAQIELKQTEKAQLEEQLAQIKSQKSG
ncbi:hypothetical protein [Psychrobacter sp. I-STPA10]|uniref:hypothetical protein n=1 Tax=Psychrobacter sp. I-STPA10 TaxID=2585769 RepID=UPI001E5DEDAA|nr:hypothetical protein [Psychrobacter sp. I-STPA10]